MKRMGLIGTVLALALAAAACSPGETKVETPPAPAPVAEAPVAEAPVAEAPAPAADAAANAAAAPAADVAKILASLPAPYNQGDLENGKRQFAKCRSCHVLKPGASSPVGPNLNGLFGRKAGTLEGFRYSPALQQAGFVWSAREIDQWLQDPKGFLPGNRMAFVGIKQETDRRDLIAYLKVETQSQ